MSIDFRGLRPRSDDPLLQIFVELQKKFVKFITSQQTDLIDSDNEDIYSNGQDMDSVIKYHSELSSQQKFTFDKKYYPAGDADLITLWLRGRDLGNYVKDHSGRNHTADLKGDPTLVDGTLDLGIHTQGIKSIARRMNRPTSTYEDREWMEVPNHTDVSVATLTEGISIFIRFRLQAIADQGGRSPTLFQKIDDASANNAYMLQAKSDGRLAFIFKNSGATIAKETATAVLLTGAVYDVWAVFDEADDSLHIYVNGTERPLQNFSGTVNWQESITNFNLQVFRRGPTLKEGFVYGDFYDLKFYREYVVSNIDVLNHYLNKWTISDIPFGHVMIANYWATFGSSIVVPGICSFSPTSFNPLSFNTCASGGVSGDGFDDGQFDPGQFD